MSTTGPTTEQGPPPGPTAGWTRPSRDELRDVGRIRRTTGPDRKVAGVAGGLARHLDVDPLVLRVAFVVLAFSGSGILLYAAAWLLLPEDGSEEAVVRLDERSRTVALVIAGAIGALVLVGDSLGGFDVPWVPVVVGLVVLLVLALRDRDHGPAPTAPPVPHHVDPTTGQLVPAAPGQWTAPPAAPRPPPRNPRRRGPVLFWWTLLLAAVAVGTLAVVDLAGADVPDPAYAATVAATCGVILLVGAFWGRAGGLPLVGLLAALATGVSALGTQVDVGDQSRTPVAAAQVPDRLATGAGDLDLDLTQVTDLSGLDGRTLHLRVRAGRIVVTVPDALTVRVEADVRAAGQIDLFGSTRGGFGITDGYTRVGPAGSPTVTVDAHAFAGEIVVRTEEERFQ
jgi:phage shock protein PspC (stress-responsive transcriptional regulator)